MILRSVNPQKKQSSRWLFLILAVELALGLAYIVVTPLWQGHEADFYNVTRFIVDYGRMPGEADYPPGQADVRQATQPPLFFVAAVPVVALLDDAQLVPPGVQPGLVCMGGEAMNSTLIDYPLTAAYQFPVGGAVLAGYGLRVVNLLFGMIAVAFTYMAARVLFPKRPAIWLVGAALLAFEPNTLQMVTTISNDALLVPVAAANLYCAARMLEGGSVRWRWSLPLIGLSALAILTRLSGWAVFGFDIVVILYAIGRTLWEAHRRAKRGQIRAAMVGLALLIVVGVGVAAFNYSQYGTIFGRYRQLDELVLRAVQNFNLPLETVVGVFDQTRLSYETPLNLLTARRPFLTLYTFPVVFALTGALAGLVVALVQRWRRVTAPDFGALVMLITAVSVAGALVLFRNTINVSASGGVTLYNTATIFAPLRYYNAALPPLALLLSAGLAVMAEPIGAHSRAFLRNMLSSNPFGIGLALLWVVVAVLGAVVMLRQRPAVELIGMHTFQAIMSELPSVSEGGFSEDHPIVHSYTADPRSEQGVVDLTLYAQESNAAPLNYAAQIDMIVDGTIVNSCQILPARGFYPTTIWPRQSVVKFTAVLPNCAGEINTPVDLSLRWLGADMNGVIQEESEPVLLGTIDARLIQPESCPQTLGIFEDGYYVTQFNTPPSVRIGETYLPSANWIVTQRSPEVAARVFLFTHAETDEQYFCAASDHTAASWAHGEYVFFDRCPMTFPPEATPGDYMVSLVMENAAGERLPATDAAGEPLPENVVMLGTVTLEE